mmetsp:Transcript_7388/g.15835  ORF Transcript_7388/g.15835 Transcript_7388/m.15835 type:complete len:81 (+) Transcript_7388:683-925(+)
MSDPILRICCLRADAVAVLRTMLRDAEIMVRCCASLWFRDRFQIRVESNLLQLLTILYNSFRLIESGTIRYTQPIKLDIE